MTLRGCVFERPYRLTDLSEKRACKAMLNG